MPVKSSKRKRDSLEQQFQHDDEFTFIRTRSKTAAAARASLDSSKSSRKPPPVKAHKENSQLDEPKNGNNDRRSKRKRSSTTKSDKPVITSEKDSHQYSSASGRKRDQNHRGESKSSSPQSSKERTSSDNFRKLQARRSSVRQRGKRASSIGNGFQTSLHPTIPPEEFYKHLDCNLPEPHQMKQLLVWCSRRALTERSKHPSDNPTETIAKVVAEKLVQNLADGRISTSWWSRESKTDDPKSLKPNPKNEENKRTMEKFQQRLTELENEKQQWTNLRRQISEETKVIQDTTSRGLSLPEDIQKKVQELEDWKIPDGLEIQADIDKLTTTSHLMESLADVSARTGKHYLSLLAKQHLSPEDTTTTIQDTTRAELRALSRLP